MNKQGNQGEVCCVRNRTVHDTSLYMTPLGSKMRMKRKAKLVMVMMIMMMVMMMMMMMMMMVVV